MPEEPVWDSRLNVEHQPAKVPPHTTGEEDAEESNEVQLPEFAVRLIRYVLIFPLVVFMTGLCLLLAAECLYGIYLFYHFLVMWLWTFCNLVGSLFFHSSSA